MTAGVAGPVTARRLAGLFAGCFVVVLIATLPLSVVVSLFDPAARGLSFTRVSGTVWGGRVEDARWRGIALGNVDVAVRPLALLAGRLGLGIALDGTGTLAGRGVVGLGLGGVAVSDLSLIADVAALPSLVPVSGEIALDLARADMGADGCRRMDGTVRTDALVDRPAGLAWRGPVLAGPVTCADGAVVVPLKGTTGSESIAVVATLARDGTFDIRIDATTPDPAVAGVLSAVGFVEAGGVMTLTQQGRWSRWHDKRDG